MTTLKRLPEGWYQNERWTPELRAIWWEKHMDKTISTNGVWWVSPMKGSGFGSWYCLCCPGLSRTREKQVKDETASEIFRHQASTEHKTNSTLRALANER